MEHLDLNDSSTSATSTPTSPSVISASAVASHPHLVLISPTTAHTGNASTIIRIATGLQQSGYRITLLSTQDTTSAAQLDAAVKLQQVDGILALHAYRCAPLLTHPIPTLIILGGTDINEMRHDIEACHIMQHVMSHASAIVAFTHAMREQLIEMCPDVRWEMTEHVETETSAAANGTSTSASTSTFLSTSTSTSTSRSIPCYLIPQAVDVPIPLPLITPPFSLHHHLCLPPTHHIFLLPASLRAVKDPFHLVTAFSSWHESHPYVHLAIIGAQLDDDMYDMTHTLPQGCKWYDGLDSPYIYHAMAQATCVINTSVSEGMCGAILEAMRIGTLVIARRNAGNASIIRDGYNGFLYDTPDHFIDIAKSVIASLDKTTSQSQSTSTSCSSTLPHPPSAVATVTTLDNTNQHNTMSASASASTSASASSSTSTLGINKSDVIDIATITSNAREYVNRVHSVEAETIAYVTAVRRMLSQH